MKAAAVSSQARPFLTRRFFNRCEAYHAKSTYRGLHFMRSMLFATSYLLLIACSSNNKNGFDQDTTVKFSTSDSRLQKIFDRAEQRAKENIADFGGRKVLIEGAQYRNIWLETQPMGGFMYAKRNLEIARNNIEIFMDHQRLDGRFPGLIIKQEAQIVPDYHQFQGFCFPMPAFEVYYWLGKDRPFLQKVYGSLEKFDAYLWKTRDSDQNGCLEAWCIYDTGEDDCVRFNGFPNAWPFDYPPTKEAVQKLSVQELKEYCKESEYDKQREMTVPIESMDIMSYSYSCREVLALISAELGNDQHDFWRAQADQVAERMKSFLWDPLQHACFDKDKNNKTMPILLHNNLRCMYYGSFDQQMADEFVHYHLLNPEEFWTPMPLPSIAANDPAFRNIPGNNWSGQPQGLTFQRSIRALENYRHYSTLTLIGLKFLKVIGDSCKFTQQFDPFTATINPSKDGYGPSILASLEFISRLYGIHLSQDRVLWSCLDYPDAYEYLQKWNHGTYKMKTRGNQVQCTINDKNSFSFSKGIRVVSDLKGKLLEVIGIEEKAKQVMIEYGGKIYPLTVKPNSIYRLDDQGIFVTVAARMSR